MILGVILEGDKEWAEAAKDGQGRLVPCPEEWKKTGHGQQICGDSIVAGV